MTVRFHLAQYEVVVNNSDQAGRRIVAVRSMGPRSAKGPEYENGG